MATAPGREFSTTTAPLAAQQINTAQVPEELEQSLDKVMEDRFFGNED